MMMLEYDHEFEKAKSCAFWYLNRRMYTKKEIIDRLIKREYDSDMAIRTADYLEELGYIDDSDYARRYISDAYNFKKHGAVRIKQDLMRKGINKLIIEEALQSIEIDQEDVLMGLINSKASSMDLSDPKQKNRLIGFLARRGFGYGEIINGINAYCDSKENFD